MHGRLLAVVVVVACIGLGACVPPTTPPTTGTVVVEGTSEGDAGFVTTGCTPAVGGRGTYRATGLGQGTYDYEVCVVGGNYAGGIRFVTEKGAQLVALIDAPVGSPATFTIDHGTGRFEGATGSVSIVFENYDETDCRPPGVCFAWKQHGTITGTITAPPKK
jgi:hypothetical protein